MSFFSGGQWRAWSVRVGSGLFLRALTLGAKFFLMVTLARHLTAAEFGVWTIIVSTATYAVFVLGLEYYNIVNRHVATVTDGNYGKIVSPQASLFAVTYIFVIPLLTLASLAGLFPFRLVIPFLLVVVVEHLSQELYRVLIVLERQDEANVLLFIRSGAWVCLVVALAAFSSIDLVEVLYVWSVGGMLAIFFFWIRAAHVLKGMRIDVKQAACSLTDILRSVAPFLVLAVALRSLPLIDRYLLKIFYSDIDVGIYGFFFSLVVGIQALYDSGVVVIFYPRLISLWHEKNFLGYRRALRLFSGATAIFWVAAGSVAYFILPWVIEYVGKPEFRSAADLFWILCFAQFLFNLSIVIHYDFYARVRDKPLARGALVYLVAGLVALVGLVPNYGAEGAAWGIFIASASLLAIRIFQYRRSWIASVTH